MEQVQRPNLAQVLAEAHAAVQRRGRSLRRRRIAASLLAGLVLCSMAIVVVTYYVNAIRPPDALAMPETTTVYYSDGTTVMARLGSQSRILVDIRTLPAYVPAAVVAAEDPLFWGGSATLISQQYVRLASGIDASTPMGRAKAAIMSWRLEDQYSKQEILGFYLNAVYFGRGAYGIEAAAKAYFGKPASSLTVAEAVILAGMLESPGDGRYDPTVNPAGARQRFETIVQRMVDLGAISRQAAAGLQVPAVNPYDPLVFQSGLDRPTGLVVAHALAELRRTAAFRDKPLGYLENGGFSIVTTVDVRAQQLLEQIADETVKGSLMYGQPDNLQAAAVVVEPGTGRVLAYYGGHEGTGADYAGWYYGPDGEAVGYGAHPPGQTFHVYALAAALDSGIAVNSTWNSPDDVEIDGRRVRDVLDAPCRPRCTLAEAATASLAVPYATLTQRLGPARVIDTARAVGIEAMWVPESDRQERRRVDLGRGEAADLSDFRAAGVALGEYPVTVLDQANAMATFAAGGIRSEAHFVRRVTKRSVVVYSERLDSSRRVLSPAAAADLTWALSQNPAGKLPDGRPSATKTGVGPLRTSAVETAHAWIVGYTGNFAMAVWIGNEEMEFPLRDSYGARVTGSGLPADIYRSFMSAIHKGMPHVAFPRPAFAGDHTSGDVRNR